MPDDVRRKTLATAIGLVGMALLYVSDPVSTPALIVVLAALVIVTAWEPVVGLGLIAFSLPLYHEPFNTVSSTFAPSEILLVATATGTLLRIAIAGPAMGASLRERSGYITGQLRRINIPFGRVAVLVLTILTIVGLALLAGVDGDDARAAGLRELRWTLVAPLGYVALLLWHMETRRERLFVVVAFGLGGLFVAAWGLIDAILGGGVSAGGVTRASGPFPHPNAFALYLLRPVVLAAAWLALTRSRSLPLWVGVGLGSAALLLSFSRSAALGLIIALIVLWPWLSRGLRILTAGGVALVAVALAVIARDRAVGGSGQDSLALRADIWESGIRMIRDHPLAGYGPDQFLYTYAPRYIDPAAWGERFTSHAHNLLIDGWIRVGIIGAVCVLLALIFIARAARDVAASSDRSEFDPLAGAAIVALAAAGVQALVDNGYFVHDLAMSAWLLGWIAFATPAPQLRRGALLHERSRDRRSRTRRIPSVRQPAR